MGIQTELSTSILGKVSSITYVGAELRGWLSTTWSISSRLSGGYGFSWEAADPDVRVGSLALELASDYTWFVQMGQWSVSGLAGLEVFFVEMPMVSAVEVQLSPSFGVQTSFWFNRPRLQCRLSIRMHPIAHHFGLMGCEPSFERSFLSLGLGLTWYFETF